MESYEGRLEGGDLVGLERGWIGNRCRQLVFVMMAGEELRRWRNLSRTACSRCLLYILHTKHYFKALTLFPPTTKHGCRRTFTSLPPQNGLGWLRLNGQALGERRQGEKGGGRRAEEGARTACSDVSAVVTSYARSQVCGGPQSRLSDGLDDSFLPH